VETDQPSEVTASQTSDDPAAESLPALVPTQAMESQPEAVPAPAADEVATAQAEPLPLLSVETDQPSEVTASQTSDDPAAESLPALVPTQAMESQPEAVPAPAADEVATAQAEVSVPGIAEAAAATIEDILAPSSDEVTAAAYDGEEAELGLEAREYAAELLANIQQAEVEPQKHSELKPAEREKAEREQAEREQDQAARKMQAIQRGQRTRKMAKENAKTGRKSRQMVEALLHYEAFEEDKLLFAQRRLLAFNDPTTFLRSLVKEYQALEMWLAHCTSRHALLEATLRLQYFFRARGCLSIEARTKMDYVLTGLRKNTRHQMAEIQELRELTRGLATRFFAIMSPHLEKRIQNFKSRLSSISQAATADKAAASATPVPPTAVGKTPVREGAEFDERINVLRGHMHVVRDYQEGLLKNEKMLRTLERLIYKFANKKEAKELQAAQDPYGPGSLGKLLKKMAPPGSAGDPIQTPVCLRAYRNRDRTAERNKLYANAIAKVLPQNVHDELVLIREQTEAVEQLSGNVEEVRRALAAMGGEGKSRLAMPRSLAHLDMDSRPGTRGTTSSRPRSRASLGQRPSRMSLGKSSGQLVAPPLAPLWACSPSTGWHAHATSQLVALPRTSSSSSLIPALMSPKTSPTPQFMEVGVGAGLQTSLEEDALLTLSTSTIKLSSGRGPELVDTYRQQLPWTPMRYKYDESRWVASERPIYIHPDRERGKERMLRIRNARSLPSLLASTYVKEPKKFNPFDFGAVIR
jgi:hypothetical protein